MTRNSPATRGSGISERSLALGAGLLCFAWAFLAWLTVIPNQDMLADAIQVQSVINDPRIVLAFPGQKHAGTVEYPFQILAELVAPGNYYVHTLPRLIFAFLTGFVAAKLFVTLFPTGPRWAFLASVAVGPSIIHGISGPAGNPVGVFWLVGNYDTSWLLVTTGALVLARNLKRISPDLGLTLLAGFLVGLGFFAHPNVTLLILPLAVLVIGMFGINLRHLAILVAGGIAGMIPSVISYFIYADITTWDPSHPPFVALSLYMNILGLTGVPDYFTVVLPYALGLPVTQDLIPGTVQSAVAWIFVIVISAVAVVGVIRSVLRRQRLSPGTVVSMAWIASFGAMILFVTFVDPVWFYATSLAVLFWITIGAFPSLIPRWSLGSWLAGAAIALAAVSTVSHSWWFYSDLPARLEAKVDHRQVMAVVAEDVQAAGATFIHGSYYDAIPIGYASSFGLRTVTNTYDRFPLSETEKALPEITVAVRVDPVDEWGKDALADIRQRCKVSETVIDSPVGEFGIFTCPPSALDTRSK